MKIPPEVTKPIIVLIKEALERLLQVQADPEIYASLHTTPEYRAEQRENLLRKGLIDPSESLLVFYNSATISPGGTDHTNTCVFMTEKRVVDVVGGCAERSHEYSEIEAVKVEHRWKLAQDLLVIELLGGVPSIFEVPRERVANSLRRCILASVECVKEASS